MKNPKRTRNLISHVLSISLAVLLIWLSLRGVNLDEFWDIMKSADFAWIPLVVGATFVSHWIRAIRWHAMVRVIAEQSSSQISIRTLFASVMIGYMANYALPRAGEIARCTYVSARKKISFSGLLGTVAAERVADTFVLFIGLLFSAFLLQEQFHVILDMISMPNLPWVWIIIGCIVLVLIISIGLRLQALSSLHMRLKNLFRKFLDGFRTVYLTRFRWRLIWTTVVMWFLYGLMAYIPLVMFGLHLYVSLTYWDAMAIMFIGALGMIVPTPGGAGSFHFITILTLTSLYGVDPSEATAYAVFLHGAQLILYLTMGGLILIFQKGIRFGRKSYSRHKHPESACPKKGLKSPDIQAI